MKLNNKGITLVEIIISVALISIVLVFLFTLLIQINNENADNEIKSSYLVNQSTFIKQIEEDFLDDTLTDGAKCDADEISKTESTKALYLPKLNSSTIDLNSDSSNHNIKCLKFTFPENKTAYLFLYKNDDNKTILSYYGVDFKQSVELEDFDWNDNKYDVIDKDSTSYKVYSLPIIGPDYNDYSINLSYAS